MVHLFIEHFEKSWNKQELFYTAAELVYYR